MPYRQHLLKVTFRETCFCLLSLLAHSIENGCFRQGIGEASDITMNTQNPPNCSLLLRSSQAVSLRYHQGVGALILFLGWSIPCCFKFIS